MKYLRSLLVFALAITLSACDLTGQGTTQQPQQPSLAELQATAMAQAEANLALTQAVMPTETPLPTPTILPPTLPSMTLPAIVSPTPNIYAGGAGGLTATAMGNCNLVSYDPSTVDVTIPDNTVVTTGQTFTKTWLVYNSGTCTWDTGYQLAFIAGDQMNAPSAIPLTGSVAPGHSLQISVPMTADSSPIPETVGNWRMEDASGTPFGTFLTVQVDVINPSTATVTFTPTSTTSSGPTVTPTATP